MNSKCFMSMRTCLLFSFALLTAFGSQNAEATPLLRIGKQKEAKKVTEAPKPVTDSTRIMSLLPANHKIEYLEPCARNDLPAGATGGYVVYHRYANHRKPSQAFEVVEQKSYVTPEGKLIKVETTIPNFEWLESPACFKKYFYVDEAGNLREFTPRPPSGPVGGTQSGALTTSPKFVANQPTKLLISGVAGPSDDFNATADSTDKKYWAIDIDSNLAAFNAQRTQTGGVFEYLPFISCTKATVPSIPKAEAAYCWLSEKNNTTPILWFAVLIEAASDAGKVSVTMVNLWTTLDILLGKTRGAPSTEYRQAYGKDPVSFDLTCDELRTKFSWLNGGALANGC